MMAAADGYVSPATWRLVLEEAEQAAKERAEQIHTQFEKATRREDIPAEWRLVEGMVDSVLVQHARYADVTILGRSDRNGIEADLAEEVMFDAGRPVLLLPPSPPRDFTARRVLVGWNGRREAARAVGDALPLIQAAEAVQVLSVFARAEEQASCGADRGHRAPPGPARGHRLRCHHHGRRRPAGRGRAAECCGRSRRGAAGGGRLRPWPHARDGAGRRDPQPAAWLDHSGAALALMARGS
ncbi:hypothetical protein [Teichococcus aestuarii]